MSRSNDIEESASIAPIAAASPEERAWRLALWSTEGIGAVRYGRLLGAFGSAEAALSAGPEACAGALRMARTPSDWRQRWGDELRAQLESQMAREGIHALARGDRAYPDRLAEADGPPWAFVRGRVEALRKPFAAVVGTRRIGTDGARMARRVVDWCAAAGWHVLSGGARGVDARAHRAALEIGLTTGVILPAGLAHITPPSHARLFDSVCDAGGFLLSEHPPWRPPRPELFARRNRLISGLSVITLVVRAPARSGALITAEWAQRQGREVFAVPGSPGDPTSAGCLALLRGGASMLTAADDLPDAEVDETDPDRRRASRVGLGERPRPSLTDSEATLFEAIEGGAVTSESLAKAVGWPADAVLAGLTRLLVAGHVETDGPGIFRVVDRGRS